jgi:hypothetical protein
MAMKVLDNPFYAGKFRFKGELHEGKHEPLLSAGEWAAYQAKRKERAGLAPRTKASEWAFAGFVVCARCGYAMVRNQSKSNTYLHCTKRRKGNGCEGVSAILGNVNLSIWSWFGSHLQEWADSMPSADEESKAADLAVLNAQAAKDQAQSRIDGLLSRAVRLDLPDEAIAGPLAEFRAELAASVVSLDSALAVQASLVPAKDVHEAILRGTEDMSTEEWRDAVGKVLAGVVVLPGGKVLIVPKGDGKVW